MSITAELDNNEGLTIHIAGRFDFSAHQSFRRTYEELPKAPESYTVDLADTTYMDSSALGMLLLLRDHAGGDEAHVRLVNCHENVRKILTISNFEQLFEID